MNSTSQNIIVDGEKDKRSIVITSAKKMMFLGTKYHNFLVVRAIIKTIFLLERKCRQA